MKKVHALHALLVLLWVLATPAIAQPFDHVVQADVLSGWRQAESTHMAALRLRLAPGWKTYWRYPGDAGLPPRLRWHGSGNLDHVQMIWPAPKVFDEGGLRSIGYEHALVLPLHIRPKDSTAPIALRGQLSIGVCREVCIPLELSVHGALPAEVVAPDPQIAAALASTPLSAAEAGVRRVTCQLEPTEDGAQIRVRLHMPPAAAEEMVVIEPAEPAIFTLPPKSHRSGALLEAVAELLHQDGGAVLLNRSTLRITVLPARVREGEGHAVEIEGCAAG